MKKLECNWSKEPPAHLKRIDTGARGFFRGDVGDAIHGIYIGPASEGLAGHPSDEDYPRAVVVSLLAETIGTVKGEKDEKEERVFSEGELILVNVRARAKKAFRERLAAGAEFWMKVTGEEKIPGGKTAKQIEIYGDDTAKMVASDAAVNALAQFS